MLNQKEIMWQRRGPESQLSVPPQLFIDSLSNGSQFSDTSAQEIPGRYDILSKWNEQLRDEFFLKKRPREKEMIFFLAKCSDWLPELER